MWGRRVIAPTRRISGATQVGDDIGLLGHVAAIPLLARRRRQRHGCALHSMAQVEVRCYRSDSNRIS
jgi:hypothetical protein